MSGISSLEGRSLVDGCASAPLLYAEVGLSFWGGVDPFSGEVIDRLTYHLDGVAYPLSVEDTKAYTRQMELYGGKALVVIEAFWRGLDALGRSRWAAAVIAVVAGALGLRLWRAARSGTG